MIDVISARVSLPRTATLPAPSQLISTSPCHELDQLVGNTPVLWTPDLSGTPGRGFWAKLEGHNPGGIKDRPGLHLIRQARDRGDPSDGAPIIESTSGTLAALTWIALAATGGACALAVGLLARGGHLTGIPTADHAARPRRGVRAEAQQSR